MLGIPAEMPAYTVTATQAKCATLAESTLAMKKDRAGFRKKLKGRFFRMVNVINHENVFCNHVSCVIQKLLLLWAAQFKIRT